MNPNEMFSKADSYERFMGRWSRLIAPELVRFAGIREGQAVLDVGSGTGALSLAVRDATATTQVTGIDLSADYVAYASRNPCGGRMRFEVGDARELPLGDATVDAAVSLLVLNFIADPARALAEMTRVTRPEGTIAAAVWDYGGDMEMLRVFWDEVVALDPGIEPRDERHMPLCRRGELAALWRARGLLDVEERPLTTTLQFTSFDDFWTPFELGQGPAGVCVAQLSQGCRRELQRRLRRRLLGDAADRSLELRGRVWAVRGRVPPRG